MRRFLWMFKNLDWLLIVSLVVLSLVSLLVLYSIALRSQDIPGNLKLFYKQASFIGIGFVIMFSVSYIKYQSLRAYIVPLYILGLGLLIGVLYFGKSMRGTTGWFAFYGFNFQPVEFVKIFLIIILAYYLSIYNTFVNNWLYFVGSLLLISPFIFLVLAEPDFGSALILGLIWLMMILFSEVKKSSLLLVFLVVAVLFVTSWFVFFKPYQKDRILSFIHPSADVLGRSYNVNQSLIAIGSGGWFGKGFLESTQTQLRFLPEASTDFIFASLTEKVGLVGIIFVFGFYGLLCHCLIRVLKNIDNDFGYFLILGIFSLFFMEIVINIGMNLGLLPVVGIALPFLSYGGSSLISSMIGIGIAQSIIKSVATH